MPTHTVRHTDLLPSLPHWEQTPADLRDAFLTGSSPSDFPAEHYERGWANRFQPHDLNDTGRRGLGLP